MSEIFFIGTDWEQSSGPIVSRSWDVSADLWPEGAASERGGGNKDVLTDGMHPVFAVGPKALRPINMTGVVISYLAANDRAILNIADGFVIRNLVANVTDYDGGEQGTHLATVFDQSLAIGEPVYVDDSDPLAAGVTLSRSPLNNYDEANPLAGYLFYIQTEYDDTGIGGADAYRDWPIVVANSMVYTEVAVLLINDHGISGLS